jgi:hypothetical protein
MSTLTLTLPDDVYRFLMGRPDRDILVSDFMRDVIAQEKDAQDFPEYPTAEDLVALQEGILAADRGEVISLDELKVFLKENKEQKIRQLAERKNG